MFCTGQYLCCHLVNAFVLHRFAKLFGHLVHETQTFGQFSKYLKTMKYCDSLFADSVIVCCSIIWYRRRRCHSRCSPSCQSSSSSCTSCTSSTSTTTSPSLFLSLWTPSFYSLHRNRGHVLTHLLHFFLMVFLFHKFVKLPLPRCLGLCNQLGLCAGLLQK